MKLQVHVCRQQRRCPMYPVMCSLSEMLIWGLTPDLSDSGRGSRWGPALPSFKRLAELKVAFKEGSPSCWAHVWVTMGSVNGWESGLSSPVILCCHLRHLIVLPRQASDIKVNSSPPGSESHQALPVCSTCKQLTSSSPINLPSIQHHPLVT